MKLALKIDVETLRGLREGVPALVDTLQRYAVDATFLFTLGPEPRTRALRSDIGRRGGDLMRDVHVAGFETGIHAWDARAWKRGIVNAKPAWVEVQMQQAIDRYTSIFGEPPRVHGAAGWRMNAHALRLTQRLGFACCSDGRGREPHLPVWNAELIRCPQLPTTLPTLDELTRAGATPDAAVGELLARTADDPRDHVYNATAELEGGLALGAFEKLLLGWKSQGRRVVALRGLLADIDPLGLPRCEVGWGSVPGCAHRVLVQQQAFLGEIDIAPA